MDNKLEEINANHIITYLPIDDKIYIAYTKNENPEDGEDVFFAECSKVDNTNILLPIISEETLPKVLKKYDEYVELMTDEEEYNILDEEEEM